MAGRTNGRGKRRGGDQGRRGPIPESQDALPLVFGGGAQEAKVANALEAPRQDVLEEAMEKLLGGQSDGAGLAILAVLAGEGDGEAVIRNDSLSAQGRAID